MTVEESSPSETQNCFFDGYSNWVQTFLEEISNNQTNGGQTSSNWNQANEGQTSNWIPDESTSNWISDESTSY